jgi:hypothetical protein
MNSGLGSTGDSLRPVWPHADALTTRDCRSLRFAGKYADVVALSTGDPTALLLYANDFMAVARPVLRPGP